MVTNTVDSSSNPNTINTPNFPQKNLTSPWAQVVRGADSQPLSPPQSNSSSSIDSCNSDVAVSASAAIGVGNSNADKNNNVGNPKKPAWNNTSSNGDVAEASSVVDSFSWPALSGKRSPKMTLQSSSTERLNFIPQEAVNSNHHPQKQGTSTANANVKPTPPMNNNVANRPRPMKRGGAIINNNESGHLQNSFPYPTQANNQLSASPPPFPVGQNSFNTTFVDGAQSYMNNNGWGPRAPVAGHVMQFGEQRNPSLRGNGYYYGNRPHNNYGIRSTSEAQTFHYSGYQMEPMIVPNPASYLGAQPPRHFLNTPPVSHEFCYIQPVPVEQFGATPLLARPPPPVFFSVANTPLHHSILNQIDYYFSDTNLATDDYLKFNMDDQGWVLVSLIAKFRRVHSMTDNIELILDSLRNSSVVEVQGNKLRRRNDWIRWLPSGQRQHGSGSVSPIGSSCNSVTADFDKITLNNTDVNSTTESSH